MPQSDGDGPRADRAMGCPELGEQAAAQPITRQLSVLALRPGGAGEARDTSEPNHFRRIIFLFMHRIGRESRAAARDALPVDRALARISGLPPPRQLFAGEPRVQR